jgi:hexosaminidase
MYRIFMRSFRLGACLFALSATPVCFTQAPALALIPMPREVQVLPDQPLPAGVRIVCPACDPQDQFAADDLAQTFESRGIPVSTSGFTILFSRHPGPSFTPAMSPEGYTIGVLGLTLTITAATPEGIFYGAQTVKQLIEGSGTSAMLHAATIRDWPAMKYRGLHDDLSRGPIPTLAFQKHLIQTLAAYKVNLYSPYFEETQLYNASSLAAPPGGAITPAEAKELSAFAARYHVMVVPEQEAFGHLRHTLIWEKYSALAETPHGAVLAPGQPGSIDLIKSWFSELAVDYPNSPFLGVGQTKADVDARGRAVVYLDFMSRIVAALQPLHRRLLFWGDIAQDAPAQLKAMPQSFKDSTIAVAWGYSPNPAGFRKTLTPFTDAGIETWVAPAINNYRQVYPNFGAGLLDIQEFTRDGQKYGATGQLNTLWNDDGETLADQNWYGLLFGAAAAWQSGESSIPAYQQAFGRVFHGDRTGQIDQAQQELVAAMDLITQAKVIAATEGTDGLFWVDPWTSDGQKFAARMRPLATAIRLHAERAIDLIGAARLAAPATPAFIPTAESVAPSRHGLAAEATRYAAPNDPANDYPSAPTSLRETNALDAVEFGARRLDFLALKFQLSDEMAAGYARASIAATSTDPKIHRTTLRELSDINGVNGRLQDLLQGYALQRELYTQTWLRSNRPYALRQVLDRYDAASAQWLARIDKVRTAQRQYSEFHTLPAASDLGIPAAPPMPVIP